MNALRRRLVGDELPVPGRQSLMASPSYAIAVHGAAPQRTVFWPALRTHDQALHQALRHPPVMGGEGQIHVDEGIGSRETLPSGSNTAETVDDPLVLAQQRCVCLEVFVVRNGDAASPILDEIERVQRQSCQLRQISGKRGFSAARVPEYGDPFHLAMVDQTTCLWSR